MNYEKITVTATVDASPQKVWDCWTKPQHIVNWNFAADDWHCPKAENDLRVGGTLCATMAAKDESVSFDFKAVYDLVQPNKKLRYVLDDGRKVEVSFEPVGDTTQITETFDAETVNSIELQRSGWQAILNNFKSYTESA